MDEGKWRRGGKEFGFRNSRVISKKVKQTERLSSLSVETTALTKDERKKKENFFRYSFPFIDERWSWLFCSLLKSKRRERKKSNKELTLSTPAILLNQLHHFAVDERW
mmetsp:Transcript_60831/g.70615  ORF Transcript_60831/g.70615 Transcript_60831/m.70615 type:complete len:108 (+) Transcript_60831:109-432(+)